MYALVFGAHGSIGHYITYALKNDKISVIGTTSDESNCSDNIIYVSNDYMDNLTTIEKVDIVIWAQGHNFNDNIVNFNADNFTQMMNANVFFILNTLHYLLIHDKINMNAKMVIISSIWEEHTRDNKLSYSITKSALSGLVKNTAYDLSSKNILINNVLPGVIDNEMTRRTLSEVQLNNIRTHMNYNRLINLEDVYRTVKFLVTENTGISGQSIKVDLGYTNLRKY